MTTDLTAATEWLADRTPEQVDKAIRLSMKQQGLQLNVKEQTKIPENGPAYSVPIAATVHGNQSDINAMIERITKAQARAPDNKLEAWLAELAAISAPRKGSELSSRMTMAAYKTRLYGYPADVSRAALLDEPWKFFPTWAELQIVCERLSLPRRVMMAALKAGPSAEPNPAAELTDEERERRREKAAKLVEGFKQDLADHKLHTNATYNHKNHANHETCQAILASGERHWRGGLPINEATPKQD